MNICSSFFNVLVSPVIRSIHSSRVVFGKDSNEKLLKLIDKMPKDTPHVAKLQSQRQAKKIAKVKYPPGTATLQVLGSGVRGSPRSLYMFTDQSWYNQLISSYPFEISYS